MAIGYIVNGPFYAQVGTGSVGALETLGVSVESGNIRIEPNKLAVPSDAAGRVPADYQYMGDLATIDFTLTSMDPAVWAKVLKLASASATNGQSGSPGALIGTGGFSHSLYLPSQGGADPWFFPTVTLTSPQNYPEGSESTKPRLSFQAWRFVPGTATTSAGIVLYTRAAP